MAFPVVEATNFGRTAATNTTSHPITLPSGVTTGDLLVVIFSSDGSGVLTTFTSGWTKLGQANASTAASSHVFWKIATGTDSLTVTTSASEQSSHHSYRISGGAYVSGSVIGGSSTNANPPYHQPPGGADDYLWIVAASHDSTVVASVAPANYSNLLTYAAAGTSGASTSSAYRTNNAASEDPGTFTSATEQWAAWTLAIHPSAPSGLPKGDHFGNASVDGVWQQWGDETGVTRSEASGKYSIALSAGNNKTLTQEPKLVQYAGWSKNEFTITTKFSNSCSDQTSVQGDRLSILVNNTNFVYASRRYDGTGFRISAGRVVDGTNTTFADAIDASAGGPVWLRIVRASNGNYSFYYSFDGSNYTWLGGVAYTYNQIDPLYIGFQLRADTNAPAHTTEVDWFSVDANEPANDEAPTGTAAGSSTTSCTISQLHQIDGTASGSSTTACSISDVGSSGIFGDHFNDGSIDSRWIEQDSIGGATYTEANGVLTISIPSGTNYDNPGEAKLWQDCDNADLVIAAKLTQNWSSASAWQQAGIVIAADNNNFIVLKYQKSSSTTYRLLWGSITGGSWYQIDQLFGQSTDKTPVYIKLTRTGNNFRAYYSDDGSSWTESTQGAYARTLTVSKIGVTAGNYNNAACDAVFDWFSVDGNEPSGASDLFSGSSSGSTSSAASIKVFRKFTGTSSGSTSSSSSIKVYRKVSGSSAGSTSSSSSIKVFRKVSGSSAGSTTSSSSIKVYRKFAGTSAGDTTTSCSIEDVGSNFLEFAGSAAGSSSSASTIRVIRKATGSAAGSTSAQSSIKVFRKVSGTSAGAASSQSTIRVKMFFAATSAGSSSASMLGGSTSIFTASSAGFASSASSVKVFRWFSASAAGSSSASANVDTGLTFTASSSGSSSAQATFKVIRFFTGASAGSATAQVLMGISISGSSAGSSTALALMDIEFLSEGSSDTICNITNIHWIDGESHGSSSGSAMFVGAPSMRPVREIEVVKLVRKWVSQDKIRHVLCDMKHRDYVINEKIRVIYFDYDAPTPPSVETGIFDFTFDNTFE